MASEALSKHSRAYWRYSAAVVTTPSVKKQAGALPNSSSTIKRCCRDVFDCDRNHADSNPLRANKAFVEYRNFSVRFRTHNFKTGLLAAPQNGQYPAGTHATLSRG